MDDDKSKKLMDKLPTDVPRCPINVAARRSGLSAHVIRAWERRYSAITPDRTSKARRLYSDWEVHRLVVLRQAVELGHRIGEIARLPIEELRALVGRDAVPGVEASPRIPLPRSRLIEVTLDAVRAFDSAGYAQSLLQATRTMAVPELFDDFVTALLAEIRAQIAAGEMRVAHERFAWAYLRDFLSDLLASSGAAPWSSTAVISTPEGDHREAAALMAAVTASRAGWDVVYAGPAVPVGELAYIVRQRHAAVVILGLLPGSTAPADPPPAPWGAETQLMLCGPGLPLGSQRELQQRLEDLRRR